MATPRAGELGVTAGGGVSDGSRPQGVDVIVNASSVEDIDPGAIGQRLSNGLARVSSPVLHRLRLREDENAEPVVMSPRWWHHPAGQARLCLPPPCRLLVFPSLVPATPPDSAPSQGTSYQKTDATVEMKRLNREQFWEQAKVGAAAVGAGYGMSPGPG